MQWCGKRPNFLTGSLALLWLYLVYRCLAGAIYGRPERSLSGAWKSAEMEIDCRPDGAVQSGQASQFVTWKGSRFIFDEAGLTSALNGYNGGQIAWDVTLARQCGVIRANTDFLEGPHVNHKQVGRAIEATVKWTNKNEFRLDEICYRKVDRCESIKAK
jgi:hypothetical protein